MAEEFERPPVTPETPSEAPREDEETAEEARERAEAEADMREDREGLATDVETEGAELPEGEDTESAGETEGLVAEPDTKKPGLMDKLTGALEKLQPFLEKIGTKLADLRISLAKSTAGLFQAIKQMPMFADAMDGLLLFIGANTSLFYQELLEHKNLTMKEGNTSLEIDAMIVEIEKEYLSQKEGNPGSDFRSFVEKSLDRIDGEKKEVTIDMIAGAARDEGKFSRENPVVTTPVEPEEPAGEDESEDDGADVADAPAEGSDTAAA